MIRTVSNLLKKQVFEKGKANWISELQSVLKQYKKTIHSSVEMKPIQASKKQMKKFQSQRQNKIGKPKFNLGQLDRTGDIEKFLVRVIQQIGVIAFLQSQKLYLILYHHIKSNFYPKDRMNTC